MGEAAARSELRLCAILAGGVVLLAPAAWADPLAEANAGMTALKAGQTKSAIRHFTQAIDSGGLSRQDLELAYVERGQALMADGDKDGARRDADDALRVDPGDEDARQLWWSTNAPAGQVDFAGTDEWRCGKIAADGQVTLTFHVDRAHRWVWSTNGESNRPLALRVSGSDLMWKWHIEGVLGKHDKHSDGSVFFAADSRLLAIAWKDDEGHSGVDGYACSPAS